MTTYDVRVKAVEHNTDKKAIARTRALNLVDLLIFWFSDGLLTTGLIYVVQELYLAFYFHTTLCNGINETKLQILVAPIIFAVGFYMTRYILHKVHKAIYKQITK